MVSTARAPGRPQQLVRVEQRIDPYWATTQHARQQSGAPSRLRATTPRTGIGSATATFVPDPRRRSRPSPQSGRARACSIRARGSTLPGGRPRRRRIGHQVQRRARRATSGAFARSGTEGDAVRTVMAAMARPDGAPEACSQSTLPCRKRAALSPHLLGHGGPGNSLRAAPLAPTRQRSPGQASSHLVRFTVGHAASPSCVCTRACQPRRRRRPASRLAGRRPEDPAAIHRAPQLSQHRAASLGALVGSGQVPWSFIRANRPQRHRARDVAGRKHAQVSTLGSGPPAMQARMTNVRGRRGHGRRDRSLECSWWHLAAKLAASDRCGGDKPHGASGHDRWSPVATSDAARGRVVGGPLMAEWARRAARLTCPGSGARQDLPTCQPRRFVALAPRNN